MERDQSTARAHCNNCGPYILHDVLARIERKWVVDDGYGVSGTNLYLLLECRGCENITLQHDSWDSENTEDDGRPSVHRVYYPPAISRKAPSWLTNHFGPAMGAIDPNMSKLLLEIYSALQNDARALAAMGIRSLLEYVMVQKIGDTGTISGNIKKFVEDGYVAKRSEQLFKDFLIEAGHAAMHRAYVPKPSDIVAMLQITESLIESIYVHPVIAAADAIPRRKR